MPLTKVSAAKVQQAGNVQILFGPKIANLASPSLAAFTLDLTCPTRELGHDTVVSFTEDQNLCDTDATTELEKRVRQLGPLRLRVDAANYATAKALFVEDAEVGAWVRPFVPSNTAATVADKGTATNARVAKAELNPIAVGNDWELAIEFYGVTRDTSAVLAA